LWHFEEINMASDMTSRRVPWVALALSFLSAGVGHLYCGRIVKGLPLYFAWVLVPLGCLVAAARPPSATGLALLLLLPAVAVLVLYVYAAIDAWRLAHRIESDYSLRDYNRAGVYWLLIVVQIVFAIGLVAGVRGFVYEAFVIPTSSMSPTILEGDRILARKLASPQHFPERGDLIVYRNPMPTGATKYIGRVVAVAGDRVEIRGERVVINGNVLQRDRVPKESLTLLGEHVRGQVAYEVNSGRRYLVTYGDASDGGSSGDGRVQEDFEATIPERHVFVLGDNRDRARDSRYFGSVHGGDIIGYVDYIYWPAESWSRFGVADDRLP
jgi:signal peptidase I